MLTEAQEAAIRAGIAAIINETNRVVAEAQKQVDALQSLLPVPPPELPQGVENKPEALEEISPPPLPRRRHKGRK